MSEKPITEKEAIEDAIKSLDELLAYCEENGYIDRAKRESIFERHRNLLEKIKEVKMDSFYEFEKVYSWVDMLRGGIWVLRDEIEENNKEVAWDRILNKLHTGYERKVLYAFYEWIKRESGKNK